jgi:hypothetical protein
VKLVLAVMEYQFFYFLRLIFIKFLQQKLKLSKQNTFGENRKGVKGYFSGETIEYILTGPRGWYHVGYESSKISSGGGKYNSTVYCEIKIVFVFAI